MRQNDVVKVFLFALVRDSGAVRLDAVLEKSDGQDVGIFSDLLARCK